MTNRQPRSAGCGCGKNSVCDWCTPDSLEAGTDHDFGVRGLVEFLTAGASILGMLGTVAVTGQVVLGVEPSARLAVIALVTFGLGVIATSVIGREMAP